MSCPDPGKLAAAMLAAVEKRDRPVVEMRDSRGTVTWVAVKPPVEPDQQGWKVIPWGAKRKPGRPKRYAHNQKDWERAMSDVRSQKKLEKAIHAAITRKGVGRQRSVDAITTRIKESEYHGVSFHTLRKRVDAVIKQWASVWDLVELYELVGVRPPVKPDRELLRELGLQSLQRGLNCRSANNYPPIIGT